MLTRRSEVSDQPVARAGLGKIERDRPGVAELGSERVEPILAPGNQHHPRAACRKLSGKVGSEPGRSTGDEGDGNGHCGVS